MGAIIGQEIILDIIDKAFNQHWGAPHKRGALKFLHRTLILRPPKLPLKRSNIVLTTDCNLRCFSCAANAGKMDTIEVTINNVARFADVMLEVNGPGSTVHLTGGEPTLYSEIETAAQIIKSRGLQVAMLTNGARLVDLENFDVVFINKHGINKAHVKRFVEHAKKYPHLEWHINDSTWHHDIEYAVEGNVTKGAKCPAWMTTVLLMGDVVYPCCNISFLDGRQGNDEVYQAMIDSGWSIHNPELADAIKNWRETLAPTIFKKCTLECWRNSKKAKWFSIEDRNRNCVP